MEKINLQSNKLKLNAQNIKTLLVFSNKKLDKLRKEKNLKVENQSYNKKIRAEEKRIETPKLPSPLKTIGSVITKGPLSFFDRVMQFAGVLLLGFLVNRLPKIIAGVQKFFDDNPWLGKTLKFTIDLIGKGFNGIISLVQFFTQEKQDNTKKDIKELETELKNLGGELDTDISGLDVDIPDLDEETDRRSDDPFVYPSGETLNIGDTVGGSDFTPPAPAPVEPPKKFSSGGKLKKTGFKNTGVSADRSIKKKKSSSKISSFSTFRKNMSAIRIVQKQEEENQKMLESIVEKLKGDVSDPFKVDKIHTPKIDEKHSKTKGSPPSQRVLPAVPYDTDYLKTKRTPYADLPDTTIVGRVGSTGASTGPHIHIETGDGYTGGGEQIPQDVLNKIIVGGKPLSQHPVTSPIGYRGHPVFGGVKFHKGIDYGISQGTPIQLHKDLKLVEYDHGYNSGYGNSIVLEDKNGNRYLIGHLHSGPEKRPSSNVASVQETKGMGGMISTIGEDLDEQSESYYVIQPVIIKSNTPSLLPLA
tara:strand:- start:3225 stop:4811 length:1587 start_codon:yes stop_codon:yes gene_type:complete